MFPFNYGSPRRPPAIKLSNFDTGGVAPQVATGKVVDMATTCAPPSVGGAHIDAHTAHEPREPPRASFLRFCRRRPRATAEPQPIPRTLLLCCDSLVVHSVQSEQGHVQQAQRPGDMHNSQRPFSRSMRSFSATFKKRPPSVQKS